MEDKDAVFFLPEESYREKGMSDDPRATKDRIASSFSTVFEALF